MLSLELGLAGVIAAHLNALCAVTTALKKVLLMMRTLILLGGFA